MSNVRLLTISCDLIYGTPPASRSLKQGDTTQLAIDVFKGSEPYSLDTLIPTLNVKRADELIYIQTGSYEINGNCLTYDLEPRIVAESGRLSLEIVLANHGGDIVSSFVFTLNIEPRLFNGSEDVAPDDADEIIDAARAAAKSATEAMGHSVSASESAARATGSADDARASALSAANSASSADTSATAAAASADAAESNATNAAVSAERAERVATANGYVVLYIAEDGCLYQRRTSNIVDKLTFWTDEKGYLWVRMV